MDKVVNPFAVKTPESLAAHEIVELFVAYPEFQILQDTGHQFLHGHRGSGKSMMLRMMEPECQSISRSCSLMEIPFFGCYLSIKATEINQPEFDRLEVESSGSVLSEHVLSTKVLGALVKSVQRFATEATQPSTQPDYLERMLQFYSSVFLHRLQLCGWQGGGVQPTSATMSLAEAFRMLADTVDEIQAESLRYIKKRSFTADAISYSGALLGFQDALLPIVKGLKQYGLVPDRHLFFLLDDADNLTLQQTKILNTWVSYRTTDSVSLKISTQLGYKTWQTSSRTIIEAPHDFTEIHFTSVKTGSVRSGYSDIVASIVEKRLKKAGLISVTAREYFPEDQKQKEGIRAIEEELKAAWHGKDGGGYRATDDAYRYARPEYIRRLGGNSKQGATYRYAGFDQLVHISSGTIRFFLEPAAKMFAEELKRSNNQSPQSISPAVQDEFIREQSNDLFLSGFDRLRDDIQIDFAGSDRARDVDSLKNLVHGIGSLFQAHLLDESASQRRVFSFQISNKVAHRLNTVLNLGIRYGYFYRDTIARKDGAGRNALYVLTRRLAPAFKLDPMGFSGYLSLTNEDLCEFMDSPTAWKRKYAKEPVANDSQLSLLEDGENEK